MEERSPENRTSEGGASETTPSEIGPSRYRLSELAEAIGGAVQGDGGREIEGLRPLDDAGPEDLSFLTQGKYLSKARSSRAGALLVAPGTDLEGRDLLVAEDPSYALSQLIPLFYPPSRRPPGIHPTAVIDETAEVDESAHVGAYVVVEGGSRVGARAVLHPGVVIGRECEIGNGTEIYANAVLYDGTRIGSGVVVHGGTVLGSDGFGYATRDGIHHKIPQVGRVVIEENVEIGANSAVDRATLGETHIGAGSKVDNLVQVGHNVHLGRGCILCGQVGIAGSAHLGNYVVLGGQAGSAGHLEVGDGVQAAARTAILQSVEPGKTVAGIPAVEIREWRRQRMGLMRLQEMNRRLRALERALKDAGKDRAVRSEEEES